MTTAAEYHGLRLSRRCIDCRFVHDGPLVRCDDCNRYRNDRAAERYGASKQPCGACHQLGHNRRRCPDGAAQ